MTKKLHHYDGQYTIWGDEGGLRYTIELRSGQRITLSRDAIHTNNDVQRLSDALCDILSGRFADMAKDVPELDHQSEFAAMMLQRAIDDPVFMRAAINRALESR